MNFSSELQSGKAFVIRQRREIAELVGIETRNKYEILNQDGAPLAYAAEQQNGFSAWLQRQVFGHWRKFEVHFFSPQRELLMVAKQPFRFLFKRLEVTGADGVRLGAFQQRYAFFYMKFDVEDTNGNVLMSVKTPFWKPWTFLFRSKTNNVAVVRKKWSGLLQEIMTDADNFQLEFLSSETSILQRRLLLASAIFIDIQYFEAKGNGGMLQFVNV